MNPTLFLEGGGTLPIAPLNGTDFQLDELYTVLDCTCIQVLSSSTRGWIVIADDEARLTGKAPTPLISIYCPYEIVGRAIHCPSHMLK